VTREAVAKAPRNTGIEEYPHPGPPSPLRSYGIREERGLRQLKDRYGVFAGNARKIAEEGFQGVATFQIVDECLHGNPRAGEDGSSA